MWTAAYPSGFQPYRKSHTNLDLWVMAGYDKQIYHLLHEFTIDLVRPSELGDRAAHSGRFPVLQHRGGRAAERSSPARRRRNKARTTSRRLGNKLTDKLGRENQVKYYRIAMGL